MDTDAHQLAMIRKRYANGSYNVIHATSFEERIHRLGRVASPEDFVGKRVLEVGAGCSTFLEIFLQFGCSALVANDLIEKRLALNGIIDSRYSEIVGDLRSVVLPKGFFDVVYANLTMMFLIPMLREMFARVWDLLAPGGHFITFDPNYLCPISIYRLLAERNGANPAQMFSPFSFARTARQTGFVVEKLVPFTGNHDWTVGNWLIGTSFGMKAKKPLILLSQKVAGDARFDSGKPGFPR